MSTKSEAPSQSTSTALASSPSPTRIIPTSMAGSASAQKTPASASTISRWPRRATIATRSRARIEVADRRQLFPELSRAIGDRLGHHDLHLHEQIAGLTFLA